MSSKKGWVLFILMLIAIVIGSFIGEIGSKISYLKWLSYGQTFSIGTSGNPFTVDFGVLKFSFYFALKINISSIIGIIAAFFLYRKI